tara:strand:- start:5107 stop:5442 length:336 start_codon:yes stop_codon:yes gene_type:complete
MSLNNTYTIRNFDFVLQQVYVDNIQDCITSQFEFLYKTPLTPYYSVYAEVFTVLLFLDGIKNVTSPKNVTTLIDEFIPGVSWESPKYLYTEKKLEPATNYVALGFADANFV